MVNKGLYEFLKEEMAAGVLKAAALRKAQEKFNESVAEISDMWIKIKEDCYPDLCKNDSRGGDNLKTYEEKKRKLLKNKTRLIQRIRKAKVKLYDKRKINRQRRRED